MDGKWHYDCGQRCNGEKSTAGGDPSVGVGLSVRMLGGLGRRVTVESFHWNAHFPSYVVAIDKNEAKDDKSMMIVDPR
jgi:hypothetical protein